MDRLPQHPFDSLLVFLWWAGSPAVSRWVRQVRCLVDVPGEKLPSAASGDLQRYMETTVAPQVPEQLRPAFLAALADGRVRSMQNKAMTCKPMHRPGALLLGELAAARCRPLPCYSREKGKMALVVAPCLGLANLLSPP